MLELQYILLGSYWLAPAWELAFGLQHGACHEAAIVIWARIECCLATLLPLSTCHAVAAMETALAAVQAISVAAVASGRSLNAEALADHLRPSVEVVDGTYGGGVATWERLAAAKLERLDAPLRHVVSDALRLCGGSSCRGSNGNVEVFSRRSPWRTLRPLSHFGGGQVKPTVGAAIGAVIGPAAARVSRQLVGAEPHACATANANAGELEEMD